MAKRKKPRGVTAFEDMSPSQLKMMPQHDLEVQLRKSLMFFNRQRQEQQILEYKPLNDRTKRLGSPVEIASGRVR